MEKTLQARTQLGPYHHCTSVTFTVPVSIVDTAFPFHLPSLAPRDSYSLSHSFSITDPSSFLVTTIVEPDSTTRHSLPKGPGSNQKSLDFRYRIHNGLVDLPNNLHTGEGGHIARDTECDKAVSTTCKLEVTIFSPFIHISEPS